MENTSSRAAQSSWFRQYEQEVNGVRKQSNDKKKIVLIIPILLIGGMIAMMIRNGAPKGGIYLLCGIGAFIIVMVLIGTRKSKATDAAAITRKDLDELFDSPETAEEFDRQMKEAPLFQVMNQKNDYVFATKDYLGMQFPYLGDATYRFIRLSDVASIHSYQSSPSRPGFPPHFDVEFCGPNRKPLMTWVADGQEKVDEIWEKLTNIKSDINSIAD